MIINISYIFGDLAEIITYISYYSTIR